MQLKNFFKNQSGQLTIQILILGTMSIIMIVGFLLWSDTYVTGVKRDSIKSQAFAVAEAGIEYYRWHLSHSPLDFKDGTSSTGPFVHSYLDKNNTRIGQFELTITPPSTST